MSTPRPSRGLAFRALSLAIVRGFVRDRTSVFFAVVFPLMFLVLFGGLFSDPSDGKVELIEVGAVPLFDDLPTEARAAFEETFTVTRSEDLADALDQVRNGDANVAVVQQGDTLVAHYTLANPAGAAITRGAMQSFVDGANVAATGRPPAYDLQIQPVEDESLDTIQYYTPGLLGWAVAMSAAVGAAATLQGWRQTRLMRRLQLAPVSTRTVVAARVAVTVAIALGQMAI
ncbi:ABC transporter permease, partial [Nocardioides sp.]|uniref:ABC transporter permease n=1 Tax=Nocardioides sp. TaxID=35761 RepID=UPI002ED9FE2F